MSWATSYIEKLKKGETVSFRPQGRSMEPYIKSGQLVTISPCQSYEVGDIVLCEVRGKQYLHFIKGKSNSEYKIGNAKGFINGWTNKIYGKEISIF